MAKWIVIEDENEVDLQVDRTNSVNLDSENVHYVSFGVDPSNANATEEDVAVGKTFYAGSGEIKTGVLDTNIDLYKTWDLANVISQGGGLASDEEYASAEVELQNIYETIMGVEENGEN